MTEVIGDVVAPSDFHLPLKTTTEANAMSGSALVSGALIFNTTVREIELWTGTQWYTISGAALR